MINQKNKYSICEKKSRIKRIESFKINEYIDKDHCSFDCVCSKGTYIRALGRDLGEVMNCFGHLYKLRRTHIGNFSTKCAILLDLSEKLIHSSAILKNILPIEKVLESFRTKSLPTDLAADSLRKSL